MRILLVEDYPPLRKNIVTFLTEAGYAVDSCDNGEEGLWYVQNHSYDAIILDIMLPHTDGLSILKDLREAGGNAPVILISALDGVDKRIEGLDTGADDFLVKPFELKELLARVKAQTRRFYDKKSARVVIEDLEIDFRSRRVFRNHQEIILTAREYNLLEYLAYRQGQIVTRQEIWTHVYEDYAGGSSNAVDVYIGYLRKKLNVNGQTNLIHTHRGQGYCLDSKANA